MFQLYFNQNKCISKKKFQSITLSLYNRTLLLRSPVGQAKVTLLAGDQISRTNFLHFTIRDTVWAHARVTLIVRWLSDRGDCTTWSDRVHTWIARPDSENFLLMITTHVMRGWPRVMEQTPVMTSLIEY